MFNCHYTLTVINRATDPQTDEITVYPHVFCGCSLYTDHATAKERGTARAASPVNKARFPLGAAPGFCPPAEWASLSAEDKATHWTLDTETAIVSGGVADVKTWAQVQAMRSHWTVTAWKDYTDTAFPHYYAEGE